MELELAQRSDEPQIKQLLARCELPYEDITPEYMRHFWVLRDGLVLVGVIGLELLGSASLLRSLAVPAPYRWRGIGTRLTREAEEHARSQGVEELYLLTTTAEWFFTKRGYHRVDRSGVPSALQETAEFQSLCPSSAVCMVKHLYEGT